MRLLAEFIEALLGLIPERHDRQIMLGILILTGFVCLGVAVHFLVDSAVALPAVLFVLFAITCFAVAWRIVRSQ